MDGWIYIFLGTCHSCSMYSQLAFSTETMKSWLNNVSTCCSATQHEVHPVHKPGLSPLSTYGSVFKSLSMSSGLKSVILISKHLTLEWWLLAGGRAPCQDCIWGKWLSSYPTRTVEPVFNKQDHITEDYFGVSAIFPNYTGLWFLVNLIDLNGFH